MTTMDYYRNEPPHSQLLTIQGTEPFNAEPPASALVEFNLTPEDLVYCRNHGPVREFDEDTYPLTVKGGVNRELNLTVKELKSSFTKVNVVAALQVRTGLTSVRGYISLLSSVCRKPTERDGCHKASTRCRLGGRCDRQL
jgi:DMSO/TMAO reductase YedYZ molybdopterin-dependent catalytic subunit